MTELGQQGRRSTGGEGVGWVLWDSFGRMMRAGQWEEATDETRMKPSPSERPDNPGDIERQEVNQMAGQPTDEAGEL